MGRGEEIRAAGRLGAEALAGVVNVVEDVHGAILGRVEKSLPPTAAPVMATQRLIAGIAYGGVATGQRALARAGAEVLHRSAAPGAPAPSQTSWGTVVLPAVNGLWGDRVAAHHPELAVAMTVRVDGHDVALDSAALGAAFPAATSRVVVFLHGLGESDQSWHLRFHDALGSAALPYGRRLHDELGLSPVYVRYNTGLRVSDNGRDLSRLLTDLVTAWPVPVTEMSLVGHSMGGLVARSACHHGDRHDATWVPAVRAVVTLGTPHLGAPLEKGVHVAEWLLRRLPETEPLSRLVEVRSVGVRDLRYGSLVEEDRFGHDPDEFLEDRCTDVPFLPHATYCFVTASIAKDRDHPAGRLIGDGLVRYPSAAGVGRTRRIPLEPHDSAHLSGVHHLALLHHPAVYQVLQAWLAPVDETP